MAMCGRFTTALTQKELESIYDALFQESVDYPAYNIAPSVRVPIITAEDTHQFQVIKWGISPSWIKNKRGLINVRAETIMDKPMFKKSFYERRCIIPATSFFEWKKTDTKKIPYLFKMKDDAPFSFAGIWQNTKQADGSIEKEFAIITTEANDVLSPIHDRMPVILHKEDEDEWLSEEANTDDLVKILSPYDSKLMTSYKVSTKVNSPSNNNVELLNSL